MKSSSESSAPSSGSPVNNAYPWMLGVSVCLSGVLCWMYVTKPVQIIFGETAAAQQEETGTVEGVFSSEQAQASDKQADSQLIPSDDVLPGVDVAGGGDTAKPKTPRSIDPRKIIALGDGSGWEKTNASMQHILRVDAGNGDVKKIVLNVPVYYQTRTMRWTATDVRKAREVLTRLMVYEGNLSKVKQEGLSLLTDWNRLLEKTVPVSAVRADSPSLPYNHSQSSDSGNRPFSGNDSAIKIEP